MIKIISADLPYPNTEEIGVDRYSASVIYPAFIGMHSELNAVIQYIYHELEYRERKKNEIAEVLMGISLCEMHHFHLLGQTLKKLGANSIFTDFPQCIKPTKFYCGEKDSNKSILDDIASEMQAIHIYQSMSKNLTNEQVKNIIERIILDEELHIKVLKEWLNSK